ncbi:VWA domain-containing protein [Taibaiella soli]|nr:VWA domain-containing protein [Taibaiella soli]
MKKTLPMLLLLLSTTVATKSFAQCGLDIMVVNDQSGSVDATENVQSRDFIVKLAQAHALGNANTQNRIALAEFSDGYAQYNFLTAGLNYTTDLSDIVAYKNAARTINGGTNVTKAILNGYQNINTTPVSGRNARKVLLIITDASLGQASAGLINYANAVQQAGGVVVVIAVADAAGIPLLGMAATPGLYYQEADYATLSANAATTINSLLTNSCTAVAAATWDLSVNIDAYDCSNNTVSYTVKNTGTSDYSGPIQTAFYNASPMAGATLTAVDQRTAQNIPTGSSQSYTFTNAGLEGQNNVVAVVNLDTSNGHALAPLPYYLRSRLIDTLEQNPYNNVSNVASGSGCPSGAQLMVTNKATAVTCDRKVMYQVQITNTGSAVANNVVPQLVTGDTNLVLISSTNDAIDASVVQTASMANPGTDIATAGYDGYSRTLVSPATINGYTSAEGATFNYTGGVLGYITNGVYSFPPTSAGSGVPYGATIISAKLTAQVGGAFNGVSSIIGGIKITNAGIWDNAASHPGDAWAAHHTGATVQVPGAQNTSLQTVDVTSIAQELVNQTGWTNNAEMAFFWHGPKNLSTINPYSASSFQITYKPAPNIAPGQTVTYTYVMQDTLAAPTLANTFDASVIVTTGTPNTLILPDTGFTVGSLTGLYGYNGSLAAHTSDDVTIAASSGCSQTPQKITTSVSITPTSICAGPGTYVTATVTINNPNTQPAPAGITFYNLIQNLNLTGTGATFAGEPYNLTNGLQLAQPALLDPAYPNVSYALSGKSGVQQLPLQQLPSGTSTFQIDIAAGSANFNMASFVNGIAPVYNAGGSTDTVQDATGVTVNAAPAISWTCPAAIAAGNTISLNATTTNATSVSLTSASSGDIVNAGSVAVPTAVYTPTPTDVANRYAAISIHVLSSDGCEAAYNCQVPITGVSFDYGDAPLGYDLGDSTVSIAAGTTVAAGLSLGVIAPGTEATAKASANADGDGNEEDGLVSTTPTVNSDSVMFQVTATNTTANPAYISGFLDYDNNGNFNAQGKTSGRILVPANSGNATYNVVFFGPKQNFTATSGYLRLRLSSDSSTVAYPFGATPQGEVEDYLVTIIAPLAVNLTSFGANAKNCDAVLNWNAVADDLTQFNVERSGADNKFVTVATLESKTGKQTYTFTDANPGAARWYYRLKLREANGKISYSAIAPVNLSNCAAASDIVSVYPNPTAGDITVTCPAFITRLEIVSLSGEVLYRYTPEQSVNRQMIHINQLGTGIYLLKTTKANGSVDVQKLIKE